MAELLSRARIGIEFNFILKSLQMKEYYLTLATRSVKSPAFIFYTGFVKPYIRSALVCGVDIKLPRPAVY